MEGVYASAIAEPTRDPFHAWRIAALLADTGKPEAALRVRAGLVEHFRAQGDRARLQAALGGQALILKARGDLAGAMALHKEEERICRELGDKDGLSISLGNQALILQTRGDLESAMALYKEQERICRELGNKNSLSILFGNQANILFDRGDMAGAMALHKEEERICRELGNPETLSRSLANQALLLSLFPGLRSEARHLADEALDIAVHHGYQQLVPGIQHIRGLISKD
jgi:tetratricopeptide (TPR) repeat protein